MASTVLLLLGIGAFIHVVSFAEGGTTLFDDSEAYDRSKPPVKIIETEDGDVIDCVDFYSQPAFRDPILKKIYQSKEEPAFLKKATAEEEASLKKLNEGIFAWRKHGGCPKGTVPIWRCNKNLTSMQHRSGRRTLSLQNFHEPNATRSNIPAERVYENAGLFRFGNYHGIKARISIWKPRVEAGDLSRAQILVLGGNERNFDSIETGWQVAPSKYGGDGRPHFYLFMTNNSYTNQSNYYDGVRRSFILRRDSPIALRSPLDASTINGEQKDYGFALEMSTQGDWILKVNDMVVGHWPHYTLPHLSKGASVLRWGGEVYIANKRPHSTTEMGSGAFPQVGHGKAANFGHVAMKGDDSRFYTAPPSIKSLVRFATDRKCYDVVNYGDEGRFGYTFFPMEGQEERRDVVGVRLRGLVACHFSYAEVEND